jgi:hypothetical protein
LLQGKRVFSTVPQIAFLTPSPPVTQPFVIGLLEREGRYDTGPLSARIRAREFDLVVTDRSEVNVRGVPLLSPSFVPAIRSGYTLFCELDEQLYYLPRDRPSSDTLTSGLLALGCRRPPAGSGPAVS